MLTIEQLRRLGYLKDEPEAVVEGGEGAELQPKEEESGAVTEETVTKEDLDRLQEALKKRIAERDAKLREASSEAEKLKAKLAEIEAQERQAKEEQERKAAEARQQKLLEQQKFEELLAEKEKEAAKAISEKDKKIQELMAQLNQSSELSQAALVQRDFDLEFVKANGLTDQADLLYPAYRKYFKYNYDTRQTEVINPATGEVMTNDLGEPYSLNDFVEGVIKKERPSSFRAMSRGGTGAQPQDGVGGGNKKGYRFEDLMTMRSSVRARLLEGKS